ncbi:NB-ARC domain-containing protein [Streptomyces sp. NPDC057743]|uniref:NB-ARC domain-containing protein n=1 Tax=Streptomyces sp. NPDC057743 TaxID=3346236 RepID=UPI00367C386C
MLDDLALLPAERVVPEHPAQHLHRLVHQHTAFGRIHHARRALHVFVHAHDHSHVRRNHPESLRALPHRSPSLWITPPAPRHSRPDRSTTTPPRPHRPAPNDLRKPAAPGPRLLIVLDNAHDSAQVDALLPGAPTCTVLVTSRDHMAGLITAHGARLITVPTLDDHGARALLTRHLGQRRVTDEPAAVAEIVTWCAGLPLALSIVTARAQLNPTIPLAALAEELRDASSRLDALAEEPPMACLETVLSWSYEQLTDEQATVFGLLGTAPGSDISLPAATSLVGQPAPKVRRVLRHLERVSLVQQLEAGRYWMHDLVRLCAATFARRKQEPAALDEALRRLTEYAAHTAHAADRLIAPHHAPIELGAPGPGCRPQPLADATEAWAWFAAERANLMAIQHAAAERSWHP